MPKEYNMEADTHHGGDDEINEAIYDKCHRLKLGRYKWLRVDFNPVVSLVSCILIWGLVIWCMVQPEKAKAEFGPWMTWITNTWTWLYIGTQDIWAVFIVVLYFSKYGNMKLGKPHDKPEYSDASYFTMLFAAGIGIGLFYFGVAEPIYHYSPGPYGNRYWGRYTDNQRAQDAMNLTFFHWGVHAWIVYVIVGLLLAFVAFRKDLPMSIRSCFYPILGERIYGFVGDLIDILSVISTMFGVCTSLGLGVMQLNSGLHRLNRDIEISTTVQVIIIWCVTALATISVITGVKVGIRRLSEICFGLGLYLMLVVFFYEDTWYILNVFVQSTGYYLQYIVQIGFHTDAFALGNKAPDGKEEKSWMEAWTIFYWGWWIAWSPFVGMFIAKISKGRTIKDFIMHCLTIPVVYSFLWMSIFGGAGLKMERDAQNLNITKYSEFGGFNSTKGLNGVYLLSERHVDDRWFDVMESYEGLGEVLSILSMAGIILYFVTSSDSGSLVIDCLSANGHPEPPVIQRIFWALTEGATATALLVAGGRESLTALRSVAIAAGLPYTVLLNFFCVALWRAVKLEAGDISEDDPQFKIEIFDMVSSGKRFKKFILAFFAPWYFIGRASGRLDGGKGYGTMVAMAIAFYGWIILMVAEVGYHGLAYLAWPCYIVFAIFGCGVRLSIRDASGIITGNLIEDFFAVLIMFPFAAVQMEVHTGMMEEDFRKKNDDYPNELAVVNSKQPEVYIMADINDKNNGMHVTPGAINPAFDQSIDSMQERL